MMDDKMVEQTGKKSGLFGDDLFGKKEAAKTVDAFAEKSIADVGARLKILEERYTNISRREQLAEQNVLEFERDLRSEIRTLQTRIVDTRRHLSELRESLEILQGQVGNAAEKYDVRVLESYLNMIQPLSFLTRAEAKKLLEDYDFVKKEENK